MEVFLIAIALIVIWVIISNLKNSLNSRFDVLQRKIDLLADELSKARKEPPVVAKVEKKSILEDEILPKVLASKTPVPEKQPEEKEKSVIKEEVKKPAEVIYSKAISAPPSHEPIDYSSDAC